MSRRSMLILFGVFLFFYIPMAYWYGWLAQPATSIDYPSYYHGARLTFVEGKTPYGFDAFDAIPPVMGRRVNPYLYPPPSLLAFWPLAKLSLGSGFVAFTIISHLCFLGSIWLILARLTPLPKDKGLREIALCISLVYLLCSDAVSSTFWLGQVNLIVLFFICLFLAALKDGAPNWRIALPLSIAILLKTYPVLLLVPLLFRRRFRAVAFTCLFFGFFTAVAILVLPVDVWSSFITKVLPAGGYASNQIGTAAPWNQSISGFVTRLLLENNFVKTPLPHPYMAKPVATVLALIVMSLTVFSSFLLSRQGDYQRNSNDEIATFLLMIYLIAPLSWDHHVVYIFPAAVSAIVLVVSGATRGFLTVALVLALFLLDWKLPVEHPSLNNGWWTLLISVKFYAVVVLWLFFFKRMRTKIRPADGSTPDTAALARASA
jgi:alpha-1,2-mannosyltransferase